MPASLKPRLLRVAFSVARAHILQVPGALGQGGQAIGEYADAGEQGAIGEYADAGEQSALGEYADAGEQGAIGEYADAGEQGAIGEYADAGETAWTREDSARAISRSRR